jgi:hypothetical protein
MPTRQGCSFLKERQDVTTLQLTTDDHFALVINAVDLKYRLGNVETDCRDRIINGLMRCNRISFQRDV